MGLLLVPLVLLAWLLASAWAGDRMGYWVEDRAWRMVVQILTFVVLLPLPVADELLAKRHFDALCRERATVQVHLPDALGAAHARTQLLPEPVESLGSPLWVQPWWVLSGPGGLVAASYETVEARGGWLARWAGPDAGQHPLTFKGYCEPRDLANRLHPHQRQPPPPGLSIG